LLIGVITLFIGLWSISFSIYIYSWDQVYILATGIVGIGFPNIWVHDKRGISSLNKFSLVFPNSVIGVVCWKFWGFLSPLGFGY